MENSDLATLIFGPTPAEATTFSEPQPEEQELFQEWRKIDLVSLLFASLPASEGSVAPLSEKELEELSEHIRSGHSSKSSWRRGCMEADGPRKIHWSVRDIDKATHTLHIDIASPLGIPIS